MVWVYLTKYYYFCKTQHLGIVIEMLYYYCNKNDSFDDLHVLHKNEILFTAENKRVIYYATITYDAKLITHCKNYDNNSFLSWRHKKYKLSK